MALHLKEETLSGNPASGSISLYNKLNELYMRKPDTSEVNISALLDDPAYSEDNYTIVNVTTTYSLNNTEGDGFTLLTNYGATQNIEITLPTSSIGKKFSFINLSISYVFTIKTQGSDKIYHNGFDMSEIYLKDFDFIEIFCIDTNKYLLFKHNHFLNQKISKISVNSIINHRGKSWIWGNGGYGQLGNNTLANKNTPVQVCGDITFCQIASGGPHSLGVDHQGKGWAWGLNQYGEIGDSSVTNRSTPVAILGNITFCKLVTGNVHSLGIDHQGKAWGWGYNLHGMIGDNTATSRRTPVAVCGDITFCQIITSEGSQSLGLDHQGKAWAWGYNTYGMLGDNTITSRRTPVAVCGDITFCQIFTGGGFHVFGIDHQGKTWVWGYNNYGQLGVNATTSRRTPVAVCGNITFCQLAVGESHSVGIDYQGKAWAWGYNNNGQLGDNTTVSKRTPVAVCGNITFCQIDLRGDVSTGLDHQGNVWTWGGNNDGQLGDNTNNAKSTPVLINYYFK